MTAWQVALGLVLAAFGVMVALGHFARALYRVARVVDDLIAVDDDGKNLRQLVRDSRDDSVRATVAANNASRVAGEAAKESATARQLASDALRATNALRADVDAMNEAVLRDNRGIWRVLAELGYDRRRAVDDDSGPIGN